MVLSLKRPAITQYQGEIRRETMFSFMFLDIYFFLFFEDLKFRISFDKTGSALGFVNCLLAISGASCLNSRYMHIYH